MIFNVILSLDARCTMDIYFEHYQGTQNNNDMLKREYNNILIENITFFANPFTWQI